MSVESERGGISERGGRRDTVIAGGDDLAKPMLRKLHAVLAATSDSRLSAIDHAVLAWLIEYADAKTGVCWPSMSTLAHVTRRSDRSMTRSVKKLLSRGYIEIVAPATPMSSIRYRVTFKDHAIIADRKKTARAHTLAAHAHLGGAGQANLTGGDADVYTGVTPTSGGHDEGVQGVLTSEVGGPDTGGHSGVTPLSTNPYHHPEHEARDDEEGPSTPSPAAADGTAAPGGALPSAAGGGVRNDWFWAHYPKHEKLVSADAYLTDLLLQAGDQGPALQATVETAAAAYAQKMKARNGDDLRFICDPIKWLKDQRWVDEQFVRTPAPKEPPPLPAAVTSPDNKALVKQVPPAIPAIVLQPARSVADEYVVPQIHELDPVHDYSAILTPRMLACYELDESDEGAVFRPPDDKHSNRETRLEECLRGCRYVVEVVSRMKDAGLWPLHPHLAGLLARARQESSFERSYIGQSVLILKLAPGVVPNWKAETTKHERDHMCQIILNCMGDPATASDEDFLAFYRNARGFGGSELSVALEIALDDFLAEVAKAITPKQSQGSSSPWSAIPARTAAEYRLAVQERIFQVDEAVDIRDGDHYGCLGGYATPADRRASIISEFVEIHEFAHYLELNGVWPMKPHIDGMFDCAKSDEKFRFFADGIIWNSLSKERDRSAEEIDQMCWRLVHGALDALGTSNDEFEFFCLHAICGGLEYGKLLKAAAVQYVAARAGGPRKELP